MYRSRFIKAIRTASSTDGVGNMVRGMKTVVMKMPPIHQGGGILSGARILFFFGGGRESCFGGGENLVWRGGEDLVTGCREGVTDDKPNSMPNLLEQLLRCEEGKARRRKGAKKGKVRRRERREEGKVRST